MIDLASIGQQLRKSLVTRLLDALGDLLHRPVERLNLPVVAVGRAVQHLRQTAGIHRILERGRPFGAERPMIDGAVGVALDIDYPAIFDVDVKTAPYRAVGADAMHNLRIANARNFFSTLVAEWMYFGAYFHHLRYGGLHRLR